MTEFPSTTTDPQLLAAIGADLQRRAGVSRSRRSGRRLGAPASAAASPPGRRGPAPKRPPGKRWKGAFRPLLVLAGAALFWWAMTHGVVDAVTQMAGRALSERILESVGGGGPDGLSCEDFDPGRPRCPRSGADRGAASTGCEWQVVSTPAEAAGTASARGQRGHGAARAVERGGSARHPHLAFTDGRDHGVLRGVRRPALLLHTSPGGDPEHDGAGVPRGARPDREAGPSARRRHREGRQPATRSRPGPTT